MFFTRLAILAVVTGAGFAASAETAARAGPRANVTAGKEIFHQNCSVCHGVDAKGYRTTGTGTIYDPNSPEQSRRVPPGDLTVLSERNGGRFPADRIRESVSGKGTIPGHGTPDMPAWGHAFDSLRFNPKRLEQRLRDLTAYLESIQEQGK